MYSQDITTAIPCRSSRQDILAGRRDVIQPKETNMKSIGSRSPQKRTRKTAAPQLQPNGPPAETPQALPPSPSGDVHVLIATRAYERYVARDYRHGFALDDWLQA